MEGLSSFLQGFGRHWQIKRILRSNSSQNRIGEERVLRKLQSSLNPLTPWNFDYVKDQIAKTIWRNPSAFVLQGLVACIIDTAVAEEAYILFGPLCASLSKVLPGIESDERCGRPITFKSVLLNICQMEFGKAISETDSLPTSYDEEALNARFVGIIRLLAECFKWRMIPEKICHHIIQVLMEPSCPTERNIEAIYHLMSSVGKRVITFPKSRRVFDVYVDKLGGLIQNPLLTPRSRVLIHNLLFLRDNNWVKGAACPRFPPGDVENLQLFHCAAAWTSNDASFKDAVEELEPDSEEEGDHLIASKAAREINNDFFEKVGKAMPEHRLLKQVEVLESKYANEKRLRKETEEMLAGERKKMEKMKELLETFKIERDNALEVTKGLLENHSSLPSLVHSDEHQAPPSFFCPITKEVMKDPHVAADGFTYEAEAIRQWLDSGHDTSPMTNLKLPHRSLAPNNALRFAIQDWLQQQR